MTAYLDRLNLRPFEKRMVVGVAALLFVVLNALFVFPHFSDWSNVQARRNTAQVKLAEYEAEIAQMRSYQTLVDSLEKEGLVVPPEDQALHFQSALQEQQVRSGVNITQTSKINNHTSQFFLELTETVSVQSKEQQLVDFLYNLGSGNSLIRVRDLTLHTDPQRQQLNANVKLVASYQKKTSARPAPPATQSGSGKAPAPAAKPATITAK